MQRNHSQQKPLHTKIIRTLALCGAIAGPTAHAADVHGVFGVGYNGGGDKLATLTFTDGDTESIDANAGLFLHGGLIFYPERRSDFGTQITLGYQFDDSLAENGNAEFTVIPLEVMQFINFSRARVGLGVTLHIDPQIDGDGIVNNLTFNFDDAAGVIAQFEFRFAENLSAGVRVTAIEYDGPGLTKEVSGNSVGGVFSVVF